MTDIKKAAEMSERIQKQTVCEGPRHEIAIESKKMDPLYKKAFYEGDDGKDASNTTSWD